MKNIIILTAFLCGLSQAQAAEKAKEKKVESSLKQAAAMKLMRPTELPKVKGSAEYFTGEVNVAPVFQGENPSTMGSGYVCFECAARSNWHTHPKGQLLVVTEGSGLIQEWGKPVRKITKGDVIWTPPGVKHWHGASSESTMCHLAIQESLDGKNVEWMERVTDEQYKAKPE